MKLLQILNVYLKLANFFSFELSTLDHVVWCKNCTLGQIFMWKKNCGANCFLCWEIEFYLTEAMQFLSFKRLTCSYYNSGSFFSSNICGLKAVENSNIWKPGPKKIVNTWKICFIDQLCWKIKALSRWLTFVLQISKKFYVEFFWTLNWPLFTPIINQRRIFWNFIFC